MLRPLCTWGHLKPEVWFHTHHTGPVNSLCHSNLPHSYMITTGWGRVEKMGQKDRRKI